MSSIPRPAAVAAVLLAAALIVPGLASAAGAARAPIKRYQARLLAREPMHEKRERRERFERLRELRKLAKRLQASGQANLRVRGERLRPETGEPDEHGPRAVASPARVTAPATLDRALSPPRPNVRCNTTTGDGSSDGQCETSIARWGNYMLAAWNDGTGFSDGTNQTQGWATSVDGGATWVDQGKFPTPAAYASWKWTSDPVLIVNPVTGAFYYAGLADANSTTSAIGVIKGRFSGTTFAWGAPSVVRTVTGNDFLDKEWIAWDPTRSRVDLSYSRFPGGISRIEFQSADSSLTSWSTVAAVSITGSGPTSEDGFVQGSRPVVTPDGTLVVVYYLIGTADTDLYRIARSADGGVSFASPNDAVTFAPNFGTGAPGFNREIGIQFPSIAVDRSGGPNDGRLYLAWAESIDWIDDLGNLGNGGRVLEVENNDAAGSGTPLTVGQSAGGSFSSGGDLYDFYKLPLTAGQSVIVAIDSLATGLALATRLFAPDQSTRLTFTQANSSDLAFGPAPWMFTAPVTGTYYLRVGFITGSGPYVITTGAAARNTERGRDQRDVFVSHSDDHGASWSTPVRVNQGAVGFDDWLPEVAVAGDGQVYCAWYDFRDATASTAGGESSVYLARSSDGGVNWAELGATSDARTAWTSTSSNIIPNQGDYLSLFADASGLVAAWSDGRGGTPDVYMSSWTAAEISLLPALLSATLTNSQVDLLWSVGAPQGFAAELYRRVDGAAWDSLGTLLSDANGHLSYTDTQVSIGHTYDWRLGVMISGSEYFYGQATIRITGELALAGVRPNPATKTSVIAFTLASNAPATLSLYDLTGRRISSRDVGALGAGDHAVPLWTGEKPNAGVYFVRLSQSGRDITKRVVVL